jgi:diguanylate cyclase (GGDEF)-like protein
VPTTSETALFLLLTGAAAVAVEVSRRIPEPSGMNANDMLAAWYVPVAVLLPPSWSLLTPVLLMALTQWRVKRIDTYKRVYSAAAIGVAHAAAASAFWAVHERSAAEGADARTVLAVAGAAVLAKALNTLLIGLAVRTADPESRWRDVFVVGDGRLELSEVCAGVLVAVAVSVSPWLVPVALPPLLLLQRGMLYAQLQTASRTDAKTGLLNAAAWERDAEAALATGRRRGLPSAVLLIDIDHFKAVNDAHGHLVGDDVLRAVAAALRAQLRDGDLLGRFGGEEFVALLPGMDRTEAAQAAERLRAGVAAVVTPVDGAVVQVTVSLGVSVADPASTPPSGLAELLAVADAGLYRAKGSGRDRVGMQTLADRRTSS